MRWWDTRSGSEKARARPARIALGRPVAGDRRDDDRGPYSRKERRDRRSGQHRPRPPAPRPLAVLPCEPAVPIAGCRAADHGRRLVARLWLLATEAISDAKSDSDLDRIWSRRTSPGYLISPSVCEAARLRLVATLHTGVGRTTSHPRWSGRGEQQSHSTRARKGLQRCGGPTIPGTRPYALTPETDPSSNSSSSQVRSALERSLHPPKDSGPPAPSVPQHLSASRTSRRTR